MESIKRVTELVDLLGKASNAYYNSEELLMSDKEFDSLFDELRQLELKTGVILSGSPTQSIGYEVKSKLQKVTHSIPLRSLGKTKSIKDLEAFQGEQDCELMLKGDGLTDEIIYEGGILIQGSTRGNGNIGEDITHNVKVFNRMPLYISFKGYLKIVGEAVILDEDFIAINEKNDGKYANSRNLVAGSVRQLDSKICAARSVNFMAFGILERKIDGVESKFKKFSEQLDFLGELGFYVIPHGLVTKEESLEVHIETMKKMAKEMGIPIDGMVLKFNDIAYGENQGSTAHHPLDAIAFKFYNEESETEYIKTEWSTSRTGQLNPVAIFKLVEIEGSEVERATLHNVDYFEELQLGRGDIVTVIKANEVIPKVTGNLNRSNTEKVPEVCPICESKTEVRLLKTSRVLFCTNEDCPSKKIAQLEHYCGRDAMNIMGVSEAILETFIDKGFIKTIPDIYSLRRYEDQIIGLEGFKETSYNNIINAIDTSKKCKFENFLFALGIPQIGKGGGKVIAKYFDNSMVKFMEAIDSRFDFSIINDIGEITNEAIHSWFGIKANKDMLMEILEHIDIEAITANEIKENPFQGKTMVVTGTLKNYSRDSIQEKLLSLGIKNTGSVSKKTDFVLVGDKPGASKYDKAVEIGIRILTEEEFEEMIK